MGEEENQIKAECFYLSKEKGVKAYKTVLSVDGRSEENIKWEEVNEGINEKINEENKRRK